MVNVAEITALKTALVEESRRLGFAACGIAPAAEDPLRAARLGEWLADGNHGDMAWMEEREHHRRSPQGLWPEARSVIEKNAQFLQANKQSKAMLEGHTDERGGREYNLALGQKRAEAVRRALALLGVSESQIEAVSFGKEKPAASGSDEAALAKNRRVEIKY